MWCALRPVVSVLLLLVHMLGLGHAAWAKHTLSESGALVDAAPLLAEKHQGWREHFCADEPAAHGDASDECLVLSGWRSPSLPNSALAVVVRRESASSTVTSAAESVLQLDVLSLAPKASPPQG